MNEKIRALAEQSGFFPVPDETEWDWEYRAENARYEKFAELIVKECIKQCEQVADDADKTSKSKLVTGDGYLLHEGMWGGATNCGEQIKEHFGVE